MKVYKYSFRRDRKGLEIAMNMVVSIIVAVLVLSIVIAVILSIPQPVPKTMEMRFELKDKDGNEVNTFKSGVSTINLTVILKDSKGAKVPKATIQLAGCEVSMVLIEKDGNYVNPTPIRPMLGPSDINGNINVIASAQDKDKCTQTILVIK